MAREIQKMALAVLIFTEGFALNMAKTRKSRVIEIELKNLGN
jgi:hypothetical protein